MFRISAGNRLVKEEEELIVVCCWLVIIGCPVRGWLFMVDCRYRFGDTYRYCAISTG